MLDMGLVSSSSSVPHSVVERKTPLVKLPEAVSPLLLMVKSTVIVWPAAGVVSETLTEVGVRSGGVEASAIVDIQLLIIITTRHKRMNLFTQNFINDCIVHS